MDPELIPSIRMMLVNRPKENPIQLYAMCVDDASSNHRKPKLDWIKVGEIYTVYSIAKALNSTGDNDMCFYIKDRTGRKIQAHKDVPAWRADRFQVLFEQCLN